MYTCGLKENPGETLSFDLDEGKKTITGLLSGKLNIFKVNINKLNIDKPMHHSYTYLTFQYLLNIPIQP